MGRYNLFQIPLGGYPQGRRRSPTQMKALVDSKLPL